MQLLFGLSQETLYLFDLSFDILFKSYSFAYPIEKGHDIAIDVERSELYCYSCIDQVYDPEFDEVVSGLGMSVKSGADVVIATGR
ncbi:unnamed protein product [Arabis nemorensis]|uniref:UBP-type domain-containing protein n=1 Tax=Arabis nemorensis TaxID=586526 RepID=A0A565ARC9_9BRAS|nr:unnamed protein product [Arabis nemorensis]